MNQTILITVWSVSALVLTSCFSGGVLQSIVNRGQTKIDSIEDMINAKNMSAAMRHNSWLWCEFEAKIQWKKPLDSNLKAIEPMVKTFSDKQLEDKVPLIRSNIAAKTRKVASQVFNFNRAPCAIYLN